MTHCQNYIANRTTNERFSRRRRDDDDSSFTSSIMTMTDLDKSDLAESIMEDGQAAPLKKSRGPRKPRGCCRNCWRMSTHTKVTPQRKLYDYLAERSTVINDSAILTKS